MTQITTQRIAEILSQLPLCRAMNREDLILLAAGTAGFLARKNTLLFQKGDAPKGVHIVVQGQVKLFIPTAQGGEKTVHLEPPGASFGEAVVFLDKPYPVSAIATRDSILLLIDREVLINALDSSPALSRRLLASLAVRLHELLADMETCTLRSSAQRLICFLTQQAPEGANRYEINLQTSKQTVASQLNLAPETLSRVLGNLAGLGLIAVQGRHITVLDHAGLQGYAG
jgi:CRP-like cAMP-binding protein